MNATATTTEALIEDCTLYAQPYNIEATGFYFTSAEEFEQKAEGLIDRYGSPVEEFEIQYIDGDDAALFEAVGVDQSNLDTWFELLDLEDHEKAALYFLCGVHGRGLSEALGIVQDVSLYEGRLIDAATELFDECYAHEIPERLRYYIDYDRFARDCDIGGDMSEFEFNGTTYTCTNAACL